MVCGLNIRKHKHAILHVCSGNFLAKNVQLSTVVAGNRMFNYRIAASCITYKVILYTSVLVGVDASFSAASHVPVIDDHFTTAFRAGLQKRSTGRPCPYNTPSILNATATIKDPRATSLVADRL